MTLENDRVIRALLRQPVDRTPLWLMRQAGRYLPEYRQLRQQAPDFMTFCKTPALACEATLQPFARFPLDAGIVFSDILTIPDALGMDLQFLPGEGPVIRDPIRDKADLERLNMKDVIGRLDYVGETISRVNTQLAQKVPLFGFAGSPWTVATYMVEGGSSRMFPAIKTMLYQAPELMHALLALLAQVTAEYLNAQIAAGVHAVMLFDTWGGVLAHTEYQEFSLYYMQQVMSHLIREKGGQPIPVVLFTKQCSPWLIELSQSGCDAIGLDSSLDMATVKKRIGSQVALQGNLDPFLLFSEAERIQQAVIDILDGFGSGPGHVFNLGHGVHKDTPIDNVTVMVEAVRQYGRHT